MIKRLIIIFICIILFCLFLYLEDTVLTVSHYAVINKRIPIIFDEFKIAQISDFHNTEFKFLRNQIVNNLKKEKPNIIVITGDFIDSNRPNLDIDVGFLDSIEGIAPIYFVMGNHETSNSSNYSLLKEELEKHNVKVLENSIDVILEGNVGLNIIGISDPGAYHNSSGNNEELVQSVLEKLWYDKKSFSILLSHRPELFDVYSKFAIDLVFCGHAHGGQIRLPFIGGLFAPGQGRFPKYTAGMFKENDTTMIISRGIGNSTFPFRVNNRPELVMVTLKTI